MRDYKIGIMQGRLSPPTDGKFQSFPKYSWKDEFYTASEIGLNCIEWIFEADDWKKNPLTTDNGISKIKDVMLSTKVNIPSVCADYFMDIPYLKSDEGVREELRLQLVWLISQAKKIGAKYIDLPFVDASRIDGPDQFGYLKEFLEPAISCAEKEGIIIALETTLNPENFKKLLLYINHPNVMANYDTGNSASLGYDCLSELSSYGKMIRTIHIKDRLLNGGTVPLGTGNAQFDIFFREVKRLGFSGPIILQAARENNEIETAKKNIQFIQQNLGQDN